MEISRREWFIRAAQTTAVGGLVIGVACVRRANAKSAFRQELTRRTNPILMRKAEQELSQMPARAREEIRTYLHGACLNVSPFVDRICSTGFNERLRALSTEEDRHALLTLEFERMVVRQSELLGRLDVIAREVGQELDQNWNDCCRKIAESWSEGVLPLGEGLVPHDVTTRVEPTVRRFLEEAQERAYVIGERPGISETASSIGRNALLLLPIATIPVSGPLAPLQIPAFLLATLAPVWRYVASRLFDSDASVKEAVSSRLALLGNRAGNEFEVQVRRLITTLQQWQEDAVMAEIDRVASERFAFAWG